ncbi:MAG: glycerol-3-phosphate responsive antiterminator [Marvinbryantia sp.]|jgi:glycerol uptake operon antiterminator
MKREELLEQFEDCPVIAAIKDEEGLQKCLESDIQIVFVLFGDICSISDIVKRLKDGGKTVIIHMDLIGGLSSREVAVTYVHRVTEADGIISTKPALIKQAKELDFFAVMRFFMLDSMAYENIKKQIEHINPDMIEIIPGAMPKVISKLCSFIEGKVPVIAGGMITDKEDTMAALNAGATAISTTKQDVWFI